MIFFSNIVYGVKRPQGAMDNLVILFWKSNLLFFHQMYYN